MDCRDKPAQTVTLSYNQYGGYPPNKDGIYNPGWSMYYTEIRHNDRTVIDTWTIAIILFFISAVLQVAL